MIEIEVQTVGRFQQKVEVIIPVFIYSREHIEAISIPIKTVSGVGLCGQWTGLHRIELAEVVDSRISSYNFELQIKRIQ